jgi:2-C-methyl-D-erythritol 4-phosphate cytidylyltransferase/2-C-methyl-D-erythritol 2,4-cyclodiphosphate synthase
MGPTVAAIIVAAGRGARFGGSPKQYRRVAGELVVQKSIRLFSQHEKITFVQPVIHRDDAALFTEATAGLGILPAAFGGATRQDSVRAGLAALRSKQPDIVLIHDAARPFASPVLVSRAIEAAARSGAAVPGLPVVDAVKSVDAAGNVTATLDRNVLRTVQTPQAFRYEALREAHDRARDAGISDFPDDAALAEWAGMTVAVFEGERSNMKITTPDDLMRAELDAAGARPDVRTATGFDVHVFGEGDHVMLGGIRIAHERALMGHSDADVVLHALTDALLGALVDGDIGQHFPPSDQKWRGASSDRFLAFAADRVRQRGGLISLLDVTILCEAPRIGPHRDAMRARIADIAGIAPGRVAVKATTMEQMGFVGREEGMAAFATATVRLPGGSDD